MPKLMKNLKRAIIKKSNNKSPAVPVEPKKKSSYRFKFSLEEEEKCLFIGEGNFSFAVAMAHSIHRADNFISTVFDSKEICCEKYPDAVENIEILEDMESLILFEVDATQLHKTAALKKKKFDKIIFNFPHVGLGIKDQELNIRANQKLISQFFESAQKLLKSNGQIVVTAKVGEPYNQWKIKELARENGLKVHRSHEFIPSDYDGYAHRRTIGFDSEKSAANNEEIVKKSARTYILMTNL
jgi:25S rRNA (uracil2634-N3)-methyltransferase